MKRFDIITEADARVLARGETVMLARRGHVTPLAQDTLRERRVTVVREGSASPDDACAGADGRHPHGGDRQRPHRRRAAAGAGGVSARPRPGGERSRAPTAPIRWTIRTSRRRWRAPVARGEADAGIVIDGAGIGSAIAANKVAGIRAVMATTETIARYSREHNGANVLTLGATLRDPGRGARHRDDLARHADARAALHPAAGEDLNIKQYVMEPVTRT